MFWTTHIIQANQRGLATEHGQPKRWLEPGKHRLFGAEASWDVQIFDLTTSPTTKSTPALAALVPEQDGAEVVVPAEHIALITRDGQPVTTLDSGRHIVWKSPLGVVETFLYDTRVIVDPSLPKIHVAGIPVRLYLQHLVTKNQRAVVTVDGKPFAWLGSGKHFLWRTPVQPHVSVETLDLLSGYVDVSHRPELVEIVPTSEASLVEVQDGQVAMLYLKNNARQILHPGTYLVWKGRGFEHRMFDTTKVWSEVPATEWHLITRDFQQITVLPYMRGLVWIDGEQLPVLKEGRWGAHTNGRDVRFVQVDMREQEVQIQGQEVMTANKVTLRLNLLVKWRVEDAQKSVYTQQNMHDALYSEAQIVARNVIAGATMDLLLEDRHDASQRMRENLATRARQWGVEIERIDIKDLILPGEMKTLLNQVIEAQKQAEAQVIMRREETSATRSQANTAKMLENNPMLLRLKELEAMQTMVQSVGQLTVVAGGQDLVNLVTSKKS